MNRTILLKKLNLYYYLVFVIVGLAAVKGFLFVKYGFTIDAKSSLGIGLSSFSLIFLLVSVPLILKYFSTKTKQIRSIENETDRTSVYLRLSLVRLGIIAFNLSLNISLYLLTQSNSFLFATGMAAVALYFCKPSDAKMNADIFITEVDNEINENQDLE